MITRKDFIELANLFGDLLADREIYGENHGIELTQSSVNAIDGALSRMNGNYNRERFWKAVERRRDLDLQFE